MIVRLLPSQVGRFWDLVKPAVVEFGGRVSPGDWDLANNALTLCLAGALQVWLLEEDDEVKTFKGVIVTAIANEDISKLRFLNLWLLFFYRTPSMELIREAKAALTNFAKANDCSVLQIHQLHSLTDATVEKWWEGKWSKKSVYTLHF